jgi:hypothetical protein
LFNNFTEGTMPAVIRAARNSSRRFVTTIPTPRRFLRCVACGTIKKERSYALCSECHKLNGQLDRGLFTCFARRADREAPEYSYRRHPEFEKACRIYARRQQRAQALAAIDSALPHYVRRISRTAGMAHHRIVSTGSNCATCRPLIRGPRPF